MSTPAPAKPVYRLGSEACRTLDSALETEWLLTDGRGAYAASTAAGCPTRRYHGWLVVRPQGDTRRFVLLARCEEVVVSKEKGAEPISVARYPGVYSPEGYRALRGFELAPWPSARYEVAGGELLREQLLLGGEDAEGSATVLVRYTFTRPAPEDESARDADPAPVELELRPLLAYREADALTEENSALDPGVESLGEGLRMQPYGPLPELHLRVGGGRARFDYDPVWYRNLQYAVDLQRGYDSGEDQWSPGVMHVTLQSGDSVVFAASTAEVTSDPRELFLGEAQERLRTAPAPDATLRERLDRSAQDFLYETVRRRPGRPARRRLGIIAGYPWFGEWGRDTFIALPGLTLARGDAFACGEVMEGALHFLDKGLLPNIYGTDCETSHYTSIDAGLWFARAVQLYDRAGAPRRRLYEEFRPALERLAEAGFLGTGLGARVDRGGLFVVGEHAANATWMDAQTHAGPVTPRHGCAVEVAALWVQLLAYLEELAERSGDLAVARRWKRHRLQAGRTFLERFWMPEEERLADVWRDGARETSLRPNMVIAASMELSPLSVEQRRGVVRAARRELVTPRGLRTLAPSDPAYRGRYVGGPEERDLASHQGSAWPWLFGFYAEAVLRAFGARSDEAAELPALLAGLEPELERGCVGHLSELYDGDEPQQPGGTFAQAWNTGELLRMSAMLESGLP